MAGTWYEVTGPSGMPIVVGSIEVQNYRNNRDWTVKELTYLPELEPLEVESLARVIDPNDWDDPELGDGDKEFSRRSAKEVLAKFRVFPRFL